MPRQYVRFGVLGLGIALVMVGMLRPSNTAFVLGALLSGVGYSLLAIRKGALRRSLQTPEMSDLVSDVREQDRALRDGMWIDEYAMRDAGPRRIMGYVAICLIGLFLIQPAYYLLARMAASAPLTTAAVVLVLAIGLAAMLYTPERDAQRPV